MFQELIPQSKDNLMGKKGTFLLMLKGNSISVALVLSSPSIGIDMLFGHFYNENRETGHSKSVEVVLNTTRRYKERSMIDELIDERRN
jgi:hypothetical protein